MFSPNFINIRDHGSFHHRFDARTLYSKPRKDECLYHLWITAVWWVLCLCFKVRKNRKRGEPTHIRSQFSKSSNAAVSCCPLGFLIQPTLRKKKKKFTKKTIKQYIFFVEVWNIKQIVKNKNIRSWWAKKIKSIDSGFLETQCLI